MADTSPTPAVDIDTRPFDVAELLDALARAGLPAPRRLGR
jgi:hypothetical protein